MRTHKERQTNAIVATTELLASKTFAEILSVEEERGLAAALPALAGWCDAAGLAAQPLSEWSRADIMRLFAQVVRAAVPLRVLPDHEAFRELNDAIPF